MESKFNITKIGNCQLVIDGEETYDSETSIENKKFTNLDLMTINIIYKVTSDETETMLTYYINSHDQVDESIYTIEEDGLYKIVHILIPTMDWLNTYVESENKPYPYVFVTDGIKLYKYKESLSLITISDILDLVTISEMLEVNTSVTNLFLDDIYTFSICSIKNCYYSICKNLLSKVCSGSCPNLKNSDTDIYKRDVLWMAINVINYLLEKGAFFEALRVLESITGCTDFCDNNTNNNKVSSCGCHSNS